MDCTHHRRGSAASSVSVTIETETASTMATPMEVPVNEATVVTVSPCPSSRRGSAAGLPATPPARIPAGFPSDPLAHPYAFPPPPPYASHPSAPASSSASVHPLSFFPFATLTPLASTDALPTSACGPPSAPPPPPSYAATPRTQAERRFWQGFLLPFLWILGARRIWHSERPAGFASTSASAAAAKDLEADLPLDVRESLELWREEELVWAKRCAWALFALLGVAAVMGFTLASVMGAI